MTWTINETLAQRVVPQVMKAFRILPIALTDQLELITDVEVADADRATAEEGIAFVLGIDRVRLLTLKEFPTITREEFAAELERHCAITGPRFLTQPVSVDLMTMLLVADDPKWAASMKDQFTNDGYEVILTTSKNMLGCLERSVRRVNQIVVGEVAERNDCLLQLRKAAPQSCTVVDLALRPALNCSERCASVGIHLGKASS